MTTREEEDRALLDRMKVLLASMEQGRYGLDNVSTGRDPTPGVSPDRPMADLRARPESRFGDHMPRIASN